MEGAKDLVNVGETPMDKEIMEGAKDLVNVGGTKLEKEVQSKTFNVMLVGKPGNGKTRTAASLLSAAFRHEKVDDRGVHPAATFKLHDESQDITLNIIDTPGLFDTSKYNAVDALDKTVKNLSKVFKQYGKIHACVIVFKYGQRFTTEESKSVERLNMLLNIESENVDKTKNFYDHCIIIFTNADSFYLEQGDLDVLSWTKGQSLIQQLVDKCGERIVLFENLRANDQTREEQKSELVKCIRSMTNNSGLVEVSQSGLYTVKALVEKEHKRNLFREKISKLKSQLFRAHQKIEKCSEEIKYMKMLPQHSRDMIEQYKEKYLDRFIQMNCQSNVDLEEKEIKQNIKQELKSLLYCDEQTVTHYILQICLKAKAKGDIHQLYSQIDNEIKNAPEEFQEEMKQMNIEAEKVYKKIFQ